MRNYLGEVLATQRDSNYQELVLGDRGRSTGQYDICRRCSARAAMTAIPSQSSTR